MTHVKSHQEFKGGRGGTMGLFQETKKTAAKIVKGAGL